MLCAEAGIGAVLPKIISVDAVCAVIVAACLAIILFIPKFIENHIVSIIVIAFALVFAVTTITAANRYYENQILPDMSHEETAKVRKCDNGIQYKVLFHWPHSGLQTIANKDKKHNIQKL